jgi:hypothetical protein
MAQPLIRGETFGRLDPSDGCFADQSTVQEPVWIKDWLLAVLRFAVTQAPCDRAAVMVLAVEMDQLGSSTSRSGFSYFSRTTTKLCECIVDRADSEKAAELRWYINSVEDDRLRRAFRAAIYNKPLKSVRPLRINGDCLSRRPAMK